MSTSEKVTAFCADRRECVLKILELQLNQAMSEDQVIK